MKLWDLRKLGAEDSTGLPQLLHVLRGHRDPISGVSVHNQDAVSFAGADVGVCNLQPPLPERLALTQVTESGGGREAATIAGLELLRHSHLLVLATEDGHIKVCC